jgi:hypothetical protein
MLNPPWSAKIEMWYYESHQEKNMEIKKCDKSYAIYPKRFYKNINPDSKVYDFCFIGGLNTDKETLFNRKWIIPFLQSNFTNDSYLQLTDKITKTNHISYGNFDYTLSKNGFVPKEHPYKDRNFFDENYFNVMGKSKFCLCPAGDDMWSMRFYEALMCKCIPIVNTVEETYRSEAEAKLDYKYYLSSDNDFIYREDWVEHNYNIFLKYHTLEFLV